MAGSWTGAYASHESGRHGDIGFSLTEGADTAFGFVVMVPHSNHDVMPIEQEPYDPDLDERATARGIRIAFVRVAGDRVIGELERYRDPECGCELLTVFEGVVRGAAIDGTFRSRHQECGRVTVGEWWVERTGPFP